jgi:peptide/nickel transport system substrate-binding protein
MKKWYKTKCISILLLTVILGSSLLVNVAVSAETDTPRYGGTLIWAMGGQPPSLNPLLVLTAYTSQVVCQVYGTLIKYDWNYQPEAELAESWIISEDGLTYTFYLRRNVKWHDGEPFTSADVVYTFDVLFRESPRGASLVGNLESITAPDDYTVVLKLIEANPTYMMDLASSMGAMIMPKHIFEDVDLEDNPYNDKPVGTGPFMFKEWVSGDHITLVKNPDYYVEGQPYLDRIVYKFYTDSHTRVLALINGEADFHLYSGFPASEIPNVKAAPNLVVDTEAPTGFGSQYMVEFNLRNEYLSDLKVRQALAHTFNMEFVYEMAHFGEGGIADGLISNLIPWAKNPDLPHYEFNIDTANDILDEAGYARGTDGTRFSLTLIYDAMSSERGKVCEIWKEDLKDVGIDLIMEPLDIATLKEKVFINWDYDLTLQSRPSGPNVVTRPGFLHSDSIIPAMYTNNMGYNSSEMDTTLDGLALAKTQEEQKPYLYTLQELVMTDLPILPYWDVAFPTVYNAEFKGDPYFLRSPFIFEELDHVYWTLGDLPEAEEPSVSIEDLDELTSTVEELVSSLASVNAKITALEDAVDDIEPAAPQSLTMVYGLGLIALLVALAAAYKTFNN